MRRLACLLLWLCLLPLAAQEPVFRIKVTMSGRRDDASYTSTLEIGYAPCAVWTGGSGGWMGSPAQYLEKAGGLAAIRPGMSLPFYAMTHTGHASGTSGSERSSATVVTTGLGTALWTETDRYGTSTKQTDTSSPPSHRQAARFYRTEKGARIADFDLGVVSAGRGGGIGCIDPYGMEQAGPQVVGFCAFELTQEELANWKQLRKSQSKSFSDGTGSVRVTVDLYVELEDPGEVEVEVEGYDHWVPEGNLDDPTRPGNTLQVVARVRATGLPGAEAERTAKVFFELQEVGGERGVCLNWPVKPAGDKGDLKLLAGNNPELEPDPDGLEDFSLRSKGLVKQARLKVSAFDFGAWGLLKVRAEDKDGKPLKVTYQGKARQSLALPKDEDHNHIADAWQEAKGVFGLPSNWDEAEVPGQTTKGDGFGLYQKYRGLVVQVGGARKHVRLEPREKAHFFIDPMGVVDLEQWWTSTEIRGYRVLEAWTQGRRVDVHRGFGAGVGKWASRFRLDDTPEPPSDSWQAIARQQWALTKGDDQAARWTPRQVEECVLYPGRVRFVMQELKEHLQVSLRKPITPNEIHTAAWLLTLGIPREDLLRRIDALGEQDYRDRVSKVMTWAAIHEACHACGLNGHLDGEGKEAAEGPGRAPDCPMQYPTKVEKLRLLLLGNAGGMGRCCSQAPHNCFRDLNPKG